MPSHRRASKHHQGKQVHGTPLAALACALLLCAAVATAHAREALNLDGYFAAAMDRSEVVAVEVELIRQAEERYRQAIASSLPALSGVAAHTRQASGARDPVANPVRQNSTRLTVTQPLFRGFRDFAALRQGRALVNAQGEDYRAARVQLYRDVAENFYDVLSLEQDLVNLGAQIDQHRARETDLEARVRIGKSRSGEVLTVQATISTLRAQVEQTRAQLSAAREAFAFLSGLDPQTPLDDASAVPQALPPLGVYLERVDSRPDVRAAQQRLAAAQQSVKAARGAHLPELDLNANRYFERSGNLADVDWDVQLTMTVPLYSGGGVQSKVREALSQRTQAELELSRTRRLAEQELRSLHQGVLLDRPQLDALEQATAAALRNFEVQQQDYSLGLVTNIDVLQAQTGYQENRLALDRARFAARLNHVRLQAAAMFMPAAGGDTP